MVLGAEPGLDRDDCGDDAFEHPGDLEQEQDSYFGACLSIAKTVAAEGQYRLVRSTHIHIQKIN
jgi:hypothetical protein